MRRRFIALSIASATAATFALAACVDLFHSTSDILDACDLDAATDGCATVSSDADTGIADAPFDGFDGNLCSLTSAVARTTAETACAWLAACETPLGQNRYATCMEHAILAYDCTANPSMTVRGPALTFWKCMATATDCTSIHKCAWGLVQPVCPSQHGGGADTVCNQDPMTRASLIERGSALSTARRRSRTRRTAPRGGRLARFRRPPSRRPAPATSTTTDSASAPPATARSSFHATTRGTTSASIATTTAKGSASRPAAPQRARHSRRRTAPTPAPPLASTAWGRKLLGAPTAFTSSSSTATRSRKGRRPAMRRRSPVGTSRAHASRAGRRATSMIRASMVVSSRAATAGSRTSISAPRRSPGAGSSARPTTTSCARSASPRSEGIVRPSPCVVVHGGPASSQAGRSRGARRRVELGRARIRSVRAGARRA